ncbi:CRM domain-containing protein, partial [Haematococcus lacustris]
MRLRVRLADDCGLKRHVCVLKLEALLDALCVQQVGKSITLYRQPGLPRPSNCPSCVVLGSQATLTKMAKVAKVKRMAAKKPPGTDEVHRDRPPELQAHFLYPGNIAQALTQNCKFTSRYLHPARCQHYGYQAGIQVIRQLMALGRQPATLATFFAPFPLRPEPVLSASVSEEYTRLTDFSTPQHTVSSCERTT